MDEDEPDGMVNVGAQHVRDHRSRHRTARLIEVRTKEQPADLDRTHAALRPLTDEANQDLVPHARKFSTNRMVIAVRSLVSKSSWCPYGAGLSGICGWVLVR